MKTSGHLIFYISENEDFELWRVLTQISPEDRAAFIKGALKKALFQHDMKPSASKPPVARGPLGDTSLSELALEELGYSAIASSLEKDLDPLNYFSDRGSGASDDPDLDIFGNDEEMGILQFDELLKPADKALSRPIAGLDFLLSNVIGEESDEEVIDFFRKKREDAEDDI